MEPRTIPDAVPAHCAYQEPSPARITDFFGKRRTPVRLLLARILSRKHARSEVFSRTASGTDPVHHRSARSRSVAGGGGNRESPIPLDPQSSWIKRRSLHETTFLNPLVKKLSTSAAATSSFSFPLSVDAPLRWEQPRWQSNCTGNSVQCEETLPSRSVLTKSRTPTDPAVWPRRARTVSRVWGRACQPVASPYLVCLSTLRFRFSLTCASVSCATSEAPPTVVRSWCRVRRRPTWWERRRRRARVLPLPCPPSPPLQPLARNMISPCVSPRYLTPPPPLVDRDALLWASHQRWAVSSFRRQQEGITRRRCSTVSVFRETKFLTAD